MSGYVHHDQPKSCGALSAPGNASPTIKCGTTVIVLAGAAVVAAVTVGVGAGALHATKRTAKTIPRVAEMPYGRHP